MSNVKLLRKQIINVIQGMLPQLLTEQLQKAMYDKVRAEMDLRLRVVESSVRETLGNIDQRARDVQSFVMRELTNPRVSASPIPPQEKNIDGS